MTEPNESPLPPPPAVPPLAPPLAPLLAEGRWLWRRIYVFGVSLGIWGLLVGIIRTAKPETLPHISDGLMGLLALLLILYLVAPTAEQLLELLAEMQSGVGGRR